MYWTTCRMLLRTLVKEPRMLWTRDRKTAEQLWGMAEREVKEYARLAGYSSITRLKKREMIYAIIRQQEKENNSV
jgi:hypothetical protein